MQTPLVFEQFDIGFDGDPFGVLFSPCGCRFVQEFEVERPGLFGFAQVRVEEGGKLLPGAKEMVVAEPRIAKMEDIAQLSDIGFYGGDDLEIDLETEVDDTVTGTVKTVKCL